MFKLEIRTDGAAFDENDEHLAELLDKVSEEVRWGHTSYGKTHSIFDANGNRCGSWKLSAE